MKRVLVLLALLALLGFATAGCGTSTGPQDNNGAAQGGAGTQGQDPGSQPAAGGLKNGAYTAAHNVCSLYPVSQLATQNGLPSNATKAQVARKISQGETSKKDQASAYKGCLDALATG
jgi:hypothetical protein